MQQPTLYLMVGLPGAGKTTVSHHIAALTGAVHLWADDHRKQKFETPKFDHAENVSLYEQLNSETAVLLGQGNSVIFDTAFNRVSDREKLRTIASHHGAKTVVVWVQAPVELAKERATQNAHQQNTRLLGDMTVEHFERLRNSLEEPQPAEQAVILDGTKITESYVKHQLGI